MNEKLAQSATAAAGTFRRVTSLEALKSSTSLGLVVEGRKLAIFWSEGNVVATNGRCPHAKGPLHEGEVVGATVTCPWHGYTFDLRSGACEEDGELRLEFFETRVDGDDVLVRV